MSRCKFRVTSSEPVTVEVVAEDGEAYEVLLTTSVLDVKQTGISDKDGKPTFDFDLNWQARWERSP